MDFFEVGQIIGFHGLKGEVKVLPYTENPERFEQIHRVYIEGQSYDIRKVRIQKGKVFLYLDGINDRTQAEKLKDKVLLIPREDADPPEEDEFFLEDLIGLKVIDKEGNKIGTLTGITQFSGPVDTFVIERQDEKEIYVPALKKYLKIIPGVEVIADIPEDLMNL